MLIVNICKNVDTTDLLNSKIIFLLILVIFPPQDNKLYKILSVTL